MLVEIRAEIRTEIRAESCNSTCRIPHAEFRCGISTSFMRKSAPAGHEFRAEFRALAEFSTRARGIPRVQACGIPFQRFLQEL